MRDNDRDGDVMCWNCFTVDDVDNDVEPITLKKVRIQQRDKLKVYPFLASELSKPKAVALKQKLSSHYQVGKKNSEKIKKITDLHSDGKVIDPQEENELTQQDKSVSDNKYVPSSHGQNVKCNKYFEDHIDATVKVQSNQFVVGYDITKRNSENENNVLIRAQKTYSIQGATILVNQSETFKTTKGYNENEDKNIDLTLHKNRFEFDSQAVPKMEGIYENANIDYKKNVNNNIDSDGEVSQQATSHTDVVDAVSNIAGKVVLKKAAPESPVPQKPVKLERLTAESGRIILKSRNSIDDPRTPEKEKIQIKDNSPKLEQIALDHSVKKKSDSFLKYLGVSKKKYNEPLKTQEEKPSTSIEDKIKNINFKMPTSETSNEITLAGDESGRKGIANDTEEVIDKCSVTNSESGYAGSSGTLKDLDANNDNIDKSLQSRTKSVEVIKSQEDDDTITVTRNEKVFTSLSSLSNIPKLSSLSKSSTITPIKKPLKSLRWSTLSMPARKFSFEDDIYVCDTSTPHHGATLPRRSNSPLPHERDYDRERFPINRSGLQARSESMASVYSGAGEARGGVAVRGEVQFSLLYNYRLGALEVGVRGCRDLAPVDVKRNRSDPYVKVYLLPDKSKSGKRKTKVKKNTLSPVFEETLSFVQPLASVAARTLWLSVWHADIFGRNDFLGEVRLPLADVVFDDPAPVWYKLHERTEQFDEQQGSRGDLIVGLKLELPDPRGKGTLRVLVKEAKNLVATKPNGLADVFCKSYLLPERGRLGKQKTGVCRRSLSPRWDHELVYRGVTSSQLATRALELSLWDRDRLASNDFMGAVRLSLGTGTYMGASVNWMDSMGKEVTLWQTMLDRPNFWVEGSLPLRPQLNN